MPVYKLGETIPRIDPTAYIHPEAVIIGNVEIGPEASVWPNAVIRGDDSLISIGARSSVQDNAVLHCTAELPTIVGEDVTLGHLCHLEGCVIEDQALIGVGAVVIHEVVVGYGSIVGANAMVRNGTIIPPYSMALGVPATVREGVVPQEANLVNSQIYVERGKQFREQMKRID
ncbi:MAG TPA: gamma carbonic anhydrase family protein [Acidimicrobiales bacterium]|jgi:carbonic anhydrase/acetyltransferase-like protein (isoleucine patch superfamily)|nr:gamma carbonic anhydrase family protein [Acidimicrobiales bacterium]|tara:strand:+ start:4364 stop:4882 length:519 start_codon:yes stop_codon:yes gene_type:complete